MDFGPHTVHIFVSLIVVLAAAGVALVCDLLKGNNEHLRELAVELKVRHEEAERRILVMEKRGKRTPDMSSVKPVMAVSVAPASAKLSESQSKVEIPEPLQAPMPKVAASASETQRQARPERRRREMSPAVAAIAQAAAAIVNNKDHQHEEVPVMAAASSNRAVREHPTVTGDLSMTGSGGGRKNWDSILKKTMSRPADVIPFESIREAVPAGFHDASVLQRAVEAGRSISGLIVSISANSLGGSNEISEFLQSLMGTQDFGCQSGADEFVLICNGEQGAAAQRRLSAISEKLWDFQLRSIGGLGVQFSWGSFEARGERISEAVASAIEQMQETRQSRSVNIAKAV